MPATRKLASFLKPYWHWSTLAPLLMVLEVSMDLLQPRFIEHIIDEGIAQSNLPVVFSTGLWMIGVAVIGLIGGVGCGVFTVLASQNFGADLRQTLFARVQALSFGNLDALETGGLITRLTNDVTQVTEMVSMLLRVMVRVPLLMVGSLIMGYLTSPRLALLFLLLIPMVAIVLARVINRAYPLFGGVQQRLDRLNTVMQENLAGVRVVKAFVRAKHELDRFQRANADLTDHNIQAVRTVAVTMPLMMLALNTGIVAALWIGGVSIDAGAMQVGQVVAFINYLMQALMALMMISMLTMRFSRAEASAVRIGEVLASQPEIQNRPQARADFAPRGAVQFDGVTFHYNGNHGDPVLKDIRFSAKPGETVALLGATGAGKSSLISLIPRFYDVADGRVTIDEVDVRDVNEAALRRQIGFALQESVLFTGTIRDNICYGRPEASDDEVISAAQAAQAHDFIMGLPNGYDSIVGQRGVNLSGGQKQRIAIARALLTDPAVLILDDSTSAVDVETEAKIQAALAQLRRGRTSFIVAQRISTVLAADKILVLDDGRVTAVGNHAELMECSPIYQEIYASQLENGVVVDG
ncbi:MAG: ABC transporter ATP-binding protein [Caldilineaceae bacterium]